VGDDARQKVRLVCDFGVFTDDTWDVCEATSTPLLFFDMHLWRRRRSDIHQFSSRVNSPQLYFEAYPGIEKDLRRVGLGNNNVVSPIVGELADLSRGNERKIVVNLGGSDSAYVPYHSNPYPFIVFKILKSVLETRARNYSIIVCCGERMAEHLNQVAKDFNYLIVSLPRNQYLAELATASLLVSQPSIHSPYEGFLMSKPTMLLPPQNFTQCFHLKQWISFGIGCPGSNLTDIYEGLSLQPLGDERRQEKLVQNVLKDLEGDMIKLKLLSDLYLIYFDRLLGDQKMLRRQKEACQRLGGDRGAAEVCRLIESHAVGARLTG
jgi:hypothetical protein